MDREPIEEATSSTVTRRQVLKTGGKLAILWSFPIIQSIGVRSAFAHGSQSECNGDHPTQVKARGEACNQAGAMRRLEKDADRRAGKFCRKIVACGSGTCGLVSRSSLSNVKCSSVDDPTCRSGKRWKCTGTITSIACQCGAFGGCDPGQACAACNVAQACSGNSDCNCWVLSPDNGGGCACLFFVQFCGQFADCPNGQSDCDANAPGTTCVQTCCGNTCTPACGYRANVGSKGGSRRTTGVM